MLRQADEETHDGYNPLAQDEERSLNAKNKLEKKRKTIEHMLRNCLGTENGTINPKGSLGVSWDGPDWRGLQLIPRTFKGNGGITRRLIKIWNEYSNHRKVRGRRSK